MTMARWHLIGAAAAAIAAAGGGTEAAAVDEPGIRPARDGNIAIRQELEAARRANTLAAYDLFILRHPRHPLVRTARGERQRLARRLRQRR
jgi:hypothetical protein